MLPQAVVQSSSQSPALAVGDLGHLSIQALALRDLALQRGRAFSDPLIQIT
jgi:hypothetical protein